MQQKHFMSHPDQTGDPQFRIVNDRKRKSSRIHVLCDVLFRLRSKNLSPVCTGTVSLHSKGFRGAKNKEPGFQRFARTKSFLPLTPPPPFYFLLSPHFSCGQNAENPVHHSFFALCSTETLATQAVGLHSLFLTKAIRVITSSQKQNLKMPNNTMPNKRARPSLVFVFSGHKNEFRSH